MTDFSFLTAIQIIGPIITAGLGTYIAYTKLSRDKKDKEEEFRRNIAVTENTTSVSLLAISSKIEKLEEKVDKISEEQSEQKASIARLEGKIESLQLKKK